MLSRAAMRPRNMSSGVLIKGHSIPELMILAMAALLSTILYTII